MALGTSWAMKLLDLGRATFFHPRKPLHANSQSIYRRRVWCRSSVQLELDRVAMGLSMSYMSFPVAPSAGFHQHWMSGRSLLTNTLSFGFLALGTRHRGGDVRGCFDAPVELLSGETMWATGGIELPWARLLRGGGAMVCATAAGVGAPL